MEITNTSSSQNDSGSRNAKYYSWCTLCRDARYGDVGSSAICVVYGDFRAGYMVVDRVNLSVLRDPFTQATSGNVRYVARRRVGGQVVLPEPLLNMYQARKEQKNEL